MLGNHCLVWIELTLQRGSITSRCSGKWARTRPPEGEDQRPDPRVGGNRAYLQRRLQVETENISSKKKNTQTHASLFKTSLALPKFLVLPKKWVAPKFGEAAAPRPSPPPRPVRLWSIEIEYLMSLSSSSYGSWRSRQYQLFMLHKKWRQDDQLFLLAFLHCCAYCILFIYLCLFCCCSCSLIRMMGATDYSVG